MSDQYTQTLEMRGLKRKAYLEYFLSIGGRLINDECIRGTDWEVHLSEEYEVKLSSTSLFGLPVVEVTFKAEYNKANELILTFRKRFLRGGG